MFAIVSNLQKKNLVFLKIEDFFFVAPVQPKIFQVQKLLEKIVFFAE